MPIYVGQPCSSCGRILTKTDDIVVCPQCGSPYHRDCYLREGKCVNSVLHETGESWQPKVSEQEQAQQQENKKIFCPNCGAENPFDSAFCQRCGTPVNMEKAAGGYPAYGRTQNDSYGYNRNQGNGGHGGSNPNMGGFPFFSNMGAYSGDLAIGNHTVEEYANYIGTNSLYFIPKFVRFERGRKWSFNFAAFLFPHLYFFYRKMIPEGIIALILWSIFSVPNLLYLLAGYGIIAESYVTSTAFINIYDICYILSYVVSITLGALANYLYFKKARADLDNIKSTVMESDSRHEALMNAGGTSWLYVLASFIATAAVCMIILMAFVKMSG